MYIALEGIDTAGKSTQIAKLQNTFNDAIITKEPGATAIGNEIRTLLLEGTIVNPRTEFLLFLADRAEHLEVVIKPNLQRLIISDRSVVSGVAYALSAQTIPQEAIIALNRFATEEILPDMVFLLELTPDELKHRLGQKELDGIESRGIDYLLQIQSNLKRAAHMLNIPLICLDATDSVESISARIIETIEKKKFI
jgi:dTMP kinase